MVSSSSSSSNPCVLSQTSSTHAAGARVPLRRSRRTYLSVNILVVATAAAAAVAMLPVTSAHAAAAPPPSKAKAAKTAPAPAPARAAIPSLVSSMPKFGSKAPAFSLVDADGSQKQRSLAEFASRPVTLMFLCGCEACAKLSVEWASLQRGGALVLAPELASFLEAAPTAVATPATAAGKGKSAVPPPVVAAPASLSPVTLIVYAGTAAELKSLVAVSGLDPAQTVLLPDASLSVTTGIYHGEPCPRVFVIDRAGVVRYVNDSPDDQPQKAEAIVIASRALTALRDAAMSAELIPAPSAPVQQKPAPKKAVSASGSTSKAAAAKAR